MTLQTTIDKIEKVSGKEPYRSNNIAFDETHSKIKDACFIGICVALIGMVAIITIL